MNSEINIENMPVGWTESVVMICSRCAQQFTENEKKSCPEKMKSDLKSLTKPLMGAKTRVITTSCLNMCPVDKIAVVISSASNKKSFLGLSVSPEVSAQELLEVVLGSEKAIL